MWSIFVLYQEAYISHISTDSSSTENQYMQSQISVAKRYQIKVESDEEDVPAARMQMVNLGMNECQGKNMMDNSDITGDDKRDT
jgi:hypothetical protein